MSRNCRATGTRRVSPQLRLETLERKELMAADLFVGPLPAEGRATHDAPSLVRAGANRDLVLRMVDLLRSTSAAPVASLEALARTFDGSGNNQANPDWGSTGEQLLRVAAAELRRRDFVARWRFAAVGPRDQQRPVPAGRRRVRQ